MASTDETFIRQTFDLIDVFEDITDPLDVQRRIANLIVDFGFEYFTITRLPQPSERLGPNMLLSIWPSGWLAHYDRIGHYRFDPVARHCYRTIEPFAWSEVEYEPEIAARARRVMDEATEHGMAAGYCVPIHDAMGFQAVVSLAGERVEMPPRVRRGIHLLGLYAWGAAERTTTRRKKNTGRLLSVRERDVLSWAAVGRTGDEIADILGVSPETVSTHLKNARHKIGTRNTTHTVVEALRRREISL
ncbi:HTH-type quorum sensing-dependent transcriptional regulator RpaR [Methylobacterium crusticola]|uniref:HTH-type quorum sensing-dependent transcriptional regulator RpaR n=1 Tax=Methylobacterium crusticola TaxID=1697972 RepID=A0ABQ4QZ76_9HYPH|nr:LuxR family transcriptional regulator [Methylobacterium crusticola]GJD50715.1 HTH-type quorum sensing-dependent transcriptional regulator RpaR [Methylobacterium crusticola]